MKFRKWTYILVLVSLWLTPKTYSQVPIISYNELAQIIESKTDTTYIINFWATWCKPCVVEIPVFEQFNQENLDKKVKIILVSLDFAKDLDKTLIPFLTKNQINSSVMLLNEIDYDTWINKIDPSWSGALPATLILNNNRKKRVFTENALTYKELIEKLSNFL